MDKKKLIQNNSFTDTTGNTNDFRLTRKEVLITVILALLTAIEILSVDLYLPAFKSIADDLQADIGKVQISLSTFLGGFALGQLVWGVLADKFGRKLPIIAGLALYTILSISIVKVESIEMFWLIRFLQAFSGSAGVVVARAIVTDVFERNKTMKVFSLLALIMGVTPIVAPSIGNALLQTGTWHSNFIAMAVIGFIILLLVVFLLPETYSREILRIDDSSKSKQTPVFKNGQFVIYTIIGSMVYSGLLAFISNSPFLIMEKGGFTGTEYSLIFGVISIGIVMGSYSINYLIKFFDKHLIVRRVCLLQVIFALLSVISIYMNAPIIVILLLIFPYLFLLGILLPATADLALEPFRINGGKASAIFGFVQLAVTFIILTIIGLIQNNSIVPMTITLLICASISLGTSLFWKNK
ncbi:MULTISPECIES: multidrug effflux MFS transporter [Flavobacterium]|uniref:multidrug effflux MFS transporter n=1 Tax=Flavobacterium TaxID=237 RepID=UPI001182CD45|nr:MULTISPECIES: multidrug effflux MFS transporter [Flavobacterium]MCR4032098.1 multidrug effflux MFS transporter [Flavobacterium panacis]